MSNTKVITKQKDQSKFKAFQIYVDMSKVDRTWEQYGYLQAPLAVKLANGNFSTRSHKSQVVIHENDFKKLLSNMNAFVPHEFISDFLRKEVLHELSDLKMSIDKEYTAHDGDSHYWTLLSDEKFKVDGDSFQVGVSIRNGIGTNVSLGADLYTMRLICTNGAVMRDKNYGSISLPHLGKTPKIVVKPFIKFIRLLFSKAKQIPVLYEKARLIKVNDKIATQIYNKMPYSAKEKTPNNFVIKENGKNVTYLWIGKWMKPKTD